MWFLKEDDADAQDFSDIYADEYDIVSELSHESSNEFDGDESDVFAEVQVRVRVSVCVFAAKFI